MNNDVSQSQPSRPWWLTVSGLLNAAAILVIAVAGIFAVLRERPASEQKPWAAGYGKTEAPEAAAPAEAAGPAVPQVVLAGSGEVSFEKGRPGTYTVLGVETEALSPERFLLHIRVRLLTKSDVDMKFPDTGFQLVIDGLPSAPDNALNESVPGNAAREGALGYQVPYGARDLALRIVHDKSTGETAELPLRLVAPAPSGGAVPAR